MATTALQITANQLNAQKSTGPSTEAGKQKVSRNALRHGIFSEKLILEDENTLEFQALLEQLQSEILPTGILEHALVERIAVAIWRQQRLIRAESAMIDLGRKPKNLVSAINNELGISYSDHALSEKDLTEFDPEHVKWCQSILDEYEQLDFDNLLDISKLKKTVPVIYQQLQDDAENEYETPEEMLQEYEMPLQYFLDLIQYCRDELYKAEQRPMVLQLAKLIKSKKTILPDKARDTLAKYQVMLDNELYKAMRALRETQEWRLKTLPVANDENGFVLEKE